MGESEVITGSMDNTVRMWNVRSGKCIQILQGHTSTVHCVHLHRKSGYLLSGSWDQTVRVWDITTSGTYKSITQIPHEDAWAIPTPRTYREIAQIPHKDAYVYDLVELDDGRMFSVCGGSLSLAVKVWELRGKGTVNTLKDVPPPQQEHLGFICGFGISGTEGVLLGGSQGNLMLLDLTSYALSLLIHNLHQREITQIKELKDHIYI